MKRRAFIREGAVLAAGLASSPLVFPKPGSAFFLSTSKGIASGIKKDMPVVVLEGSPRNRGRIHGETLRPKIKEVVSIWRDFLHKSRKMHPDEYLAKFLEDTNFKPAILKWTPDLLEETLGISEGSGVDFDTIYAFQLMDEEWWYGNNLLFEKKLKSKNCSGLGVFGQDGLFSMQAQNMDLPRLTDGFQTILHIKHSESSMESFAFTFAGFIVTNGMNNRPIGVCVNTLSQLNYSTDGLPVAYAIRGVLEKSTLEEAVGFIKEVKHASGQNYIIGGKEKVFDFEASAHSVVRFVPYEDANRVYHTNHPLVNEDQQMLKAKMKKLPPPTKVQGPSNTEIRFQALEKRLKDSGKIITLDTIKETLSSHDNPENPVCRHLKPDGGGMTFGCAIMVLSDSPEFHVAPGPPCETEFYVFKL